MDEVVPATLENHEVVYVENKPESGGSGGGGGGGGDMVAGSRPPQSAQSVPGVQSVYSIPGPPSSHIESLA